MLASDGVDSKIIGMMIDTLFKETDLYRDMDTNERLIQAARAYKRLERYQRGLQHSFGLLRLLLA